jgi:aminopeptidase N
MWFGDLVTMRWWDDLWLNESFAEWASHWCNSQATRFRDAWTTFLSVRKSWGYRQDQLSSTHPVYCEMPDVDAVEVNFDGITYAKGASVIKQLVAYVGTDTFVTGLRSYFDAHAWGNATFDDLLSALEEASGRPLRDFANQWLLTAQVNTLRPVVTIGEDGSYTDVTVLQDAPPEYPTLRTHRLAVGLYDLTGERLVRRKRLELDVSGPETAVSALTGERAADVLLLNDDDLTYAKMRLDERSMAAVVRHISGLDSSLARALCWAAAWDMMRDAELAARDYVALAVAGLPGEADINLVTATQRQAHSAALLYADPAWRSTGLAMLADLSRAGVTDSEPGGGFQLAWARALAGVGTRESDLDLMRGWLEGRDVPDGLTIDTELRWTLVSALVAAGAADPSAVDAELDRDRTASGERAAAQAHALVPTPESKAETWRRLTSDEKLPNWLQRALLMGFHHPLQTDLTEPYVTKFFDVVADIWATRDSEPAQEFVFFAYPTYHVSQATIDATDAWLATDGHPAPLRRLVAEGRDSVVRSLKAREKDATA